MKKHVLFGSLGAKVGGVFFVACIFLQGKALADKSGLAANRLKLPKGPGSIEGVGEDAEVDINMGLVSYKVPFAVPSGYAGMSPSFALGYAASSGNGPVGIGWSLSGGARIERQTSKGLPEYNADDGIVAFGGAELVLVEEQAGESGSVTRKYRARYEGGFSLYTWVDRDGDGRSGYWKVESPDGKVSYFGANRFGERVQNARLESEWMEGAEEQGGTFCWELVEQIDLLGHRIVHGYEQHGGRPYLRDVQWVLREDGSSRYRIVFEYEGRQDPLSDGKPGVEVRWARRLSNVLVTVNDARLRSYEMEYEPYEESGGLSRLTRVQQYGMDEEEGAYPIEFQFAYTGTFDPVCEESSGGMGQEACSAPQVHQVGSVGVDFATGRADLIDINGDALPDVVDTSDEGGHQLHIQTMDMVGDGDAQAQMMVGGRFMVPAVSQLQTGAFQLTSPQVHMVDLDGNGRSDMVDGANNTVLFNEGEGDWHERREIAEMRLPALHEDANAKFFDVNGDHRIDVIRIGDDGAFWFENQGHWKNVNVPADGRGFKAEGELLSGIPNNIGFVESGLQLADMNGDGLQDLVQPLRAGVVQYFMNLGWGRFVGSPENPQMARAMGFDCPPAEERDCLREQNAGDGQADSWELVDINGDSLSDLVRVVGISIEYALNRGGQSFSPITLLEGNLPEREAGTSIRYADMNGSGSTDIVYIDSSGMVQYVELFARRPNLLSKVENGIGKVIELTYGTSVAHMARDGGPEQWRYRLPNPMLVLEKVVSYDTLSEVKQIQAYHYKHGYYDGTERQFRGFEYVEVHIHGDNSMEPGKGIYHYEVGVTDPYRKGLLLEQEAFSNNEPLSLNRSTYEDCPLEGVPQEGDLGFQSLKHPIRFICSSVNDTVIKERRPEQEWVTLRDEKFYDGYGNVVVSKNHGVVSVGGGACNACPADWDENYKRGEACGAQCLGDEQYEQTWFIAPSEVGTGGKWILRAAHTKRTFGVPDSPLYTEIRMYYDGDDFIGLAHGRYRQGLLKRTTTKKRVGSPEVIETERFAHNRHGNVIALLDANDHRRTFSYDDEGILLESEEIHFDDPTVREDGSTYSLKQTVTNHPVLESVVSSTAWQRVEGGAIVSEPRLTRYHYDAFGRIRAIAKPGDILEAPTQVFDFELRDPVSRIITRQRTEVDGPLSLESIRCFDGKGRKFQERTKVSDGVYQTDGFSLFNVQGEKYRAYQPYVSNGASCDPGVPEGILFMEHSFDAQGRSVSAVFPDDDIYGEASHSSTVYGPLWVTKYDSEDTDPESPHFNTPETSYSNGQDHVMRMERLLAPDDAPITLRFYYDGLGRFNGLTDDAGNYKRQSRDLLGRITRIVDPDSGITRFQYDDVGNVLQEEDARGVVVVQQYDEVNRMMAQWQNETQESTLITWTYDKLFREDTCEKVVCAYQEGFLAKTEYPLLRGRRGIKYFGYDERGRDVGEEIERRGYRFAIEKAYDQADRLVETRFPGDIRFSQILDGAGRLKSVPGHLEDVRYDERGLLQSFELSNQTKTVQRYDAQMRLERLVAHFAQVPWDVALPDVPDSSFMALRYTRSREGHISHVEDERMGLGVTVPSANAQYNYDALYRLTEASLDEGRQKAEALTYSYSRADNLISKVSSQAIQSKAHVGELLYGSMDGEQGGEELGGEAQGFAGPHAMIRAGPYGYRYDAAGQMIYQGDKSLTHIWDHRGRITETSTPHETLIEYAYDQAGQRTEKFERGRRTDYLSNEIELRDGIVTVYLKLGSNRIAKVETAALTPFFLPDLSPLPQENVQIEPDGYISVADAWALHAHQEGFVNIEEVPQSLDEVDELSELLNAAAHMLILGEDEEVTTYFHHNHLGSTSVTTDEQGQVLQTSLQYPYGQVRYASAQIPDYSFTGQEIDLSTTLSYHSARYLHPYSGRWVSPDPLFVQLGKDAAENPWQAANLYGYVLNNPIHHIDSTGGAVETAWDVANVAMGASSLGLNIAVGNYGGAIVDAIGIVLDTAATAVPFVPGGAGTAIKVYRGADKAVDMIRAADKTLDAVRAVDKAVDVSKNGGKLGNKIVKQSEKASKITGKKFSKEKQALVDMAKKDKKKGSITKDDMEAYKELNKELKDSFPSNKVRGPEQHPNRPSGKEPHGHVGPVNHIPIK